jgi:hypothetical protein
MPDESWRGDWRDRVYSRVRSCGYETVTVFAEEHPRATIFELVDLLTDEEINGAQLVALMRDEAERDRSIVRFARSLLVHALWERIPNGWRIDPGNGSDFDFKAASALASVISELPDSARGFGTRLARIMMSAELPIGWLPTGPDDPIVIGLFERAVNQGE